MRHVYGSAQEQPKSGAHRYRTAEFCKLSGCSVRRAQWWDEGGIICPILRKHQRLYSDLDVVLAAIAVKLRDKHIDMRYIRPLVDWLRENAGEAQKVFNGFLVYEAGGFKIAEGALAAVELALAAKEPVHVIDVEKIVREIKTRAQHLRRRAL